MIELGLIGRPLGHSQSPDYFAKKFAKDGIRGMYSLFPLESIHDLPGLIESHPNLRGFNVTVPYKQEVMKYLMHISPEAGAIGAVNTVKIDRTDGKSTLTGYNTDWTGFVESFRTMIDLDRKIETGALILGTGGASKAIAYGLHQLHIPYTFVSRNPSTHESDLTTYACNIIAYNDLTADILRKNRIIVNCTPLGMWPNVEGCPDIPWNLIPENAICYDLVYNPSITEFMKRAKSVGARVKNGLEMLHGQADAAWDIWLNR